MEQFQDRQDAQIWNAIEAKNFKQALKLVDKRLAKKRTEYHEVRVRQDCEKTHKHFFLAGSPFLCAIT